MPTLQKINGGEQLKISLADKEKTPLFEELRATGALPAWFDLLEGHLANGWTAPSPDAFALCTNPFLLSDDISYDDHGEMTHCGRVYYYEPHQIKCPIEELIEKGEIVLESTCYHLPTSRV